MLFYFKIEAINGKSLQFYFMKELTLLKSWDDKYDSSTSFTLIINQITIHHQHEAGIRGFKVIVKNEPGNKFYPLLLFSLDFENTL